MATAASQVVIKHLLTYTRSSRCLCRDKRTNYLSVPRRKACCSGYLTAQAEVLWYQPLPDCPESPRATWGTGWKATQHHSAPEMWLRTSGHCWGPLPITARHTVPLPPGCSGCWRHPGFLSAAAVLSSMQQRDANRPLPQLVQVLLAAWRRAPQALRRYPWIFAAPEARRGHCHHPVGPAAPWPQTAPLLLHTTLPSSFIP